MAPRNWDGRYRRVAPTNVAKKKKEICEREWRRSLTWDIVHLLLLYTHIRKKEKSVCASIFIYIYLSDANTQKSWNSQAGVNRLPSFSHWMKKRRTSFPIGRERERERERESDHFHIQHEYLKKWRVCVPVEWARVFLTLFTHFLLTRLGPAQSYSANDVHFVS